MSRDFWCKQTRKFGHRVELAAHVSKFRLWKFLLNNFPFSRNVSPLKIGICLLSFIWSCVNQVVILLPFLVALRYLRSPVVCHVTCDVNKPLNAQVFKLRLWKFILNNFPLLRNVSPLKIGICLLSFIWSCVKQVVILLPLKQMRRMLQEALRHGIIELVLRTVMYLIRYFQGV